MDRAPARDEGRGCDAGADQANVIALPHCGKDRRLARLDGVNQIAHPAAGPFDSGLPFRMTTIALRPIGKVESRLTDVAEAPRQPDEGAPEAWLVIDAEFAAALEGLKAGDEVIVITWLDRADRDILCNHPRGDPSRPVAGVFTTRSPHRPNPLGLHQVTVAAIDGSRVLVRSLEAVDGTPILDIKGFLNPDIQQR
jgi:tRNA-Thr(GGU) m(6)t(6)A37 methyltransferase TsaA